MASSCGGDCRDLCSKSLEESKAPETLASLSLSLALCSKCCDETPIHNNLCRGCFRASLFGKFKLAVTSNAMISPLDNVLVAFSGGPSSRVALQFVHEMQLKSQISWDASKDQSLPVFGVGVAFIDESFVLQVPLHEFERETDEIRSLVSTLFPPSKKLHIAPIESIFSEDKMDNKIRLKKILETIDDSTGREDFLQYLRLITLQKIALDNGYSKLILGSCTNGIACHIISSTVKGRGYALPADIQYVDARWDVPVLFPLRDCIDQELVMLCHLDGLKIQKAFDQPHCGINNLVSSFLARLQEENPSRARTIVRTGDKLKPFHFRNLSDGAYNDMLPSRVRRKLQLKLVQSTSSDILCPICRGPLSGSDLVNLKNGKAKETCNNFAAHCCASCSYQILPRDAALLEDFYSLLPRSMIEQTGSHSWLREQVEDFLLSDGDEGD